MEWLGIFKPAMAGLFALGLLACQNDKDWHSLQLPLDAVSSAKIAQNQLLVGTPDTGAWLFEAQPNAQPPISLRWHWQMTREEPAPTLVGLTRDASITGRHEKLGLWNAASGQLIQYLATPAPINVLSLNETAPLLGFGLKNRQLLISDRERGGLVKTLDLANPVTALHLFDQQIWAGDDTGRVCLWAMATVAPLVCHQHTKTISAVSASPDKQFLVSAGQFDQVSLWQATPPYALAHRIPLSPRGIQMGLAVMDMQWEAASGQLFLWLLLSDKSLVRYHVSAKQPPHKTHQWYLGGKPGFQRRYSSPVALGLLAGKWTVVFSDGSLKQWMGSIP